MHDQKLRLEEARDILYHNQQLGWEVMEWLDGYLLSKVYTSPSYTSSSCFQVHWFWMDGRWNMVPSKMIWFKSKRGNVPFP